MRARIERNDVKVEFTTCASSPREERWRMLLGWTTVSQRVDADRLAHEAVMQGLAACVQIDGPIISHYRWQGKIEQAAEFRLCFKFLPRTAEALGKHVLDAHPYDVPEWIVVRAEHVSEKYLSWADANSSTLPL